MLSDCASCGGLLPAGRRCCPHCHCKTAAWRRIVFVVVAALGLARAGCNTNTTAYGGVVYDYPDESFDTEPTDAGSDGSSGPADAGGDGGAGQADAGGDGGKDMP